MAKVRILKWLFKHSPINFYSVSENGETIIKSINNTFIGYKFGFEFSQEQIEAIRKLTGRYKRLSTISILVMLFLLIYGIFFPNYTFFYSSAPKMSILVLIALFIPLGVAFFTTKFFEKYLSKSFGNFTKIHFPASNSIENQSYRDFKIELVKIFILLSAICIVICCIGSPYTTSASLISKGKYQEAIRITSIWTTILPIEPEWYSLRAYARFQTGDYQGAIKDFDKAYKLEHDEYRMINFDNKIYVKYFIKDYESAIQDFDEEINNAQDEYSKDQFLWDKAQFLYNIGEYKDALKIYNTLLINSDDDNIYLLKNRLFYERAQIYKVLGKEFEASCDLEKAQELNLEEDFQNPIPAPSMLINEL